MYIPLTKLKRKEGIVYQKRNLEMKIVC